MTILFILDAGEKSCFYLLSLDNAEKKLLRVGPNIMTQNRSLGETYSQESNKFAFTDFFKKNYNLNIDRTVILSEKTLEEFLFFMTEKIEINNPKAFTFHGECTGGALSLSQDFPKGRQLLDKASFKRFITYQEDSPNVFGIFARQEHILRLIKERLFSSLNPIVLSKRFNEFKEIVETDLSLKDVAKILGLYRETRGKKIQRDLLRQG